jgi:PKD repeat protein
VRKTVLLSVFSMLLIATGAQTANAAPRPPTDRTAPAVVFYSPVNGTTNVPTNEPIVAKYNEALQPVAIYTLTTGSGKSTVNVPVTASYNNDTFTVSLVPNSPLAANTVHKATLTVKDVAGNSSTKLAWSFTTGAPPPPLNVAPVARLSVTPTSGDAPLAVSANGSASTDDKAVTSYAFEWGDGTSTGEQASATANHTYTTTGQFTVVLTVKDAGGLTSTTSVVVSANEPAPPTDNAPVAKLTVDPPTATVPVAVTADASASTDVDASPIESYTFEWGDGTTDGPQVGATAGHSFENAGTYTVTVTVVDTAGLSSTATANVLATAPKYRPINNDCSAGYVNFTFDDGPDVNTPAVREALQGLGIKAVFFVNGRKINGNTFGQDQIRLEYAEGHTVQNHTYDHASITGISTGTRHLTDAEITAEMETTSDAIVAAGVPKPTLYRPPFGDIDAYSDNLIRNLGYRIVAPWAYQYNADGPVIDTKDWEGATVAQIVQRATVGFTNSAGRFYPGMADKAIILFHDGQTDPTLNSIQALQPIVDYMNEHHFCATTDVRANATGGLVPPPAPAYPSTGNLVVNPSLETLWAPGQSVASTVPDCFEPNNNSKATVVWSTTSDAHTGVVAEKVVVTNWTGDDSKLVVVQRGLDTATANRCNPPVTVGKSYTTWVHYKGTWPGYGASTDTTKVGIVTYYRIGANAACPTGGTASPSGWCYWQSSPLVPPSSTWNLASFTTAPLPAEATAVSFGLGIKGNGTLITDDYALVEN